MILWIDGPYGVGKSTLARALHAGEPDSFIFDAETVRRARSALEGGKNYEEL